MVVQSGRIRHMYCLQKERRSLSKFQDESLKTERQARMATDERIKLEFDPDLDTIYLTGSEMLTSVRYTAHDKIKIPSARA